MRNVVSLIYVVIAAIFLLRDWSRTRIALAAVVAVFPTASHLFLETPADQYRTWATRPDVNLLGISSPLLGAAAVIVTVLLSIVAFAAFVSVARSRVQDGMIVSRIGSNWMRRFST